MFASDFLTRAINGPGPRALGVAVVAGALLILAGASLLAMGKVRLIARTAGALGVLVLMLVLVVTHRQTVVERPDDVMTVTRPRYPDYTRRWLAIGMLGLPVSSSLVMYCALVVNRRRLRSTVPAHLKEGVREYYAGHHDAARAAFDKALAIAPERGEAYWRRGCLFEAVGDRDRALADLDRAIQLDPRIEDAYLRRGRLRTEAGALEGALSDFERALVVRPNDPEAFFHRGICLLKRGDPAAAAEDFERVLHLTNVAELADPARDYLREAAKPREADSPLSGPVG